MWKRMLIVIGTLVIVLVLIFGGRFYYLKVKYEGKSFAPPPPTISTGKVTTAMFQPTIQAVGSVVAVQSVNVTSQVSGSVAAIHFQSGEKVKKGELLVQLDDSIDRANLVSAQAQYKSARLAYARIKRLYQQRVVSKSDFDKAQATFVSAQAAVQSARVAIEHKHITAPFTGVLGIRQINLGQFISPGDAIVSLQQYNPIFVDFYLPEQDLAVIKVGQPVAVHVDQHPGKAFAGRITAINSHVDTDTRNILVRAEVNNPKHLLFPGNYAEVSVQANKPKSVVVVPRSAISYSLFGDGVYVVENKPGKNGKVMPMVKQVPVTVGENIQSGTVVADGLKPGQTIVTSGQNKLRNNIPVSINNSVKLKG